MEKSADVGMMERERRYGISEVTIEHGKPGVTEQTHRAERSDGSAEPQEPAGLREMEAITTVWTKNWLIAAYAA